MAYDSEKIINLGQLKTAMETVEGEMVYTNTAATTAALGGIAKGTTFENKKITEVLDALLYPYVKPSVKISASATVHELGASTSRVLTVTVTAGSKSITSVKIVSGSTTVATLTAAAGAYTQTVTVSAASTTYTAQVFDGGTSASATASVTLTGVNPYYYGVVASAPTTSAGVTALTSLVQSKGTKGFSFTTTDDAPRYCLCYPASYGTLSTAKDVNGFEHLDTFTRTTVSVTNAAGTSVSYYVYTYANDVAASTMKFTFSY